MNRKFPVLPRPPQLKRNSSYTQNTSKQQTEHYRITINDSFHNSTGQSECKIAKQYLKVLQEENINLKQQNVFLLGKLRILSDKEQHRIEVQEKYKTLINQLMNKNQDLQNQISELNNLMHTQMFIMNQKINSLAQKQNDNSRQTDQFNSLKKKQKPGLTLSSYLQCDQVKQKIGSQTMTSRQIEQLGTEFNRLYQNGKSQRQRSKKKQIRLKMTQITSQMSQKIKQNQ